MSTPSKKRPEAGFPQGFEYRPGNMTPIEVERLILETTRYGLRPDPQAGDGSRRHRSLQSVSTRYVADLCGVSNDTVQRVWSRHGLRPSLVDTVRWFDVEPTAVIGLYLGSPVKGLVYSMEPSGTLQSEDCSAIALRAKTIDPRTGLPISLSRALDEERRRISRPEFVLEHLLGLLDAANLLIRPGDRLALVIAHLPAADLRALESRLADMRDAWQIKLCPTDNAWLVINEKLLLQLECRRHVLKRRWADIDLEDQFRRRRSQKRFADHTWLAAAG